MAGIRLGIATTTYNRRAMLLAQLDALNALTESPFELVVCDDGSTDGTADAVRDRGVRVIGGLNRGMAWNKNRGLFHLKEIAGCDVLILLDDDVVPTIRGWEREWIEMAEKHGHGTYMSPGPLLIGGENTASIPGLTYNVGGACMVFSRQVLSRVGYMDTRFGRCGHEHTDLSFRTIRAGFGGFVLVNGERRRHVFYTIEGGVKILPRDSHIDHDSLAANGALLELSEKEPIYRNPWRSVEEYEALLGEVAASEEPLCRMPTLQEFHAETYLVLYPDVRNAGIDAWEHFRDNGFREGRSFTPAPARPASFQVFVGEGSVVLFDGRPAMQRSVSPPAAQLGGTPGDERGTSWQVDLGRIATISEIHVFAPAENSGTGVSMAFGLSIAVDADQWVEIPKTGAGFAEGDKSLVCKPAHSAWARFVRVTALGETGLNLDRVVVLGSGG